MTGLIDIEEFRSAARSGAAAPTGIRRFVTDEPTAVEGQSRTLRWIFSDGSVDRMTDTIDPKGWELDRYKSNPVILWAHDSLAPPIGMAVDVLVVGSKLVGDVCFAEPEVYEFAETIFRLVQGKYIRAGSVGFLPLDWAWSKDKSRPNGIDFKRQELMEFSICPIPANPNALAEARSAGIDTRPLIGWAEKLLDGGERILIPRAELDELRKAAAEPRAAAHLAAINAGFLTVEEARKLVGGFTYALASPNAIPLLSGKLAGKDVESSERPLAKTACRDVASVVAKDLNDVSWLASLLQSLAALEDWVEWETEIEGDNSPIAGRLAAVLQVLGQILIDMTAEEVAELLGGEAEPDAASDPMGGVMMAARTPGQKALVALARMARRGMGMKAGRVLSAKNEADIQQARDLIDGVLTQVAAVTDDDAGAEEKAAARLRKAKALRRRLDFAA